MIDSHNFLVNKSSNFRPIFDAKHDILFLRRTFIWLCIRTKYLSSDVTNCESNESSILLSFIFYQFRIRMDNLFMCVHPRISFCVPSMIVLKNKDSTVNCTYINKNLYRIMINFPLEKLCDNFTGIYIYNVSKCLIIANAYY